MRFRGRLRLLVAVLAALLAASVGSGALQPTATTIGVGFTISAEQTTVGVTVGAEAVVAVNVSQPGSWVGPISLSVTGAPVGAHIGITPNPMIPGIPAVISILTAGSTPVGSYYLHITATSGTYTQTITVVLVVSLPTGFTMFLSPPSRTVVDGESTSYDLSIDRGLLAGPIALKVTGVPANATAKVTPGLSILGNSAKVTINTATNVVPGTYLITVKGSSLLASATASAYLIVLPQTYPNFPIAGTPDRLLAPGSEPGAIDLAITNPFTATMTVTALGVTVTGTSIPGCSVGNYDVIAYGGPFPLTIPPNSTRTLSQLGVPRAQWPQVRMLNLPVNQDVCKTATVQLHYSGTGSGA